MGNAYEAYVYNKDKASRLLILVRLKTTLRGNISAFIDDLDSMPPLFPLPIEQMPLVRNARKNFIEFIKNLYNSIVKPTLDEYTRVTDEVCLEQTLIAIVTMFETYLKDKYEELSGEEDNKYVFQRIGDIENAYREFQINVFENETIKKNVGFILQVRHILVHNTGKVDKKFIENCTRFGYWDSDFVIYDKREFVERKHINFILSYDFLLNVYNLFATFIEDLERRLNELPINR